MYQGFHWSHRSLDVDEGIQQEACFWIYEDIKVYRLSASRKAIWCDSPSFFSNEWHIYMPK